MYASGRHADLEVAGPISRDPVGAAAVERFFERLRVDYKVVID